MVYSSSSLASLLSEELDESEDVSDEDDCIGEESTSHSAPSAASGLGIGAIAFSAPSTFTPASLSAVGKVPWLLPPTEVGFGDSV